MLGTATQKKHLDSNKNPIQCQLLQFHDYRGCSLLFCREVAGDGRADVSDTLILAASNHRKRRGVSGYFPFDQTCKSSISK
jgi:hypothetical protein